MKNFKVSVLLLIGGFLSSFHSQEFSNNVNRGLASCLPEAASSSSFNSTFGLASPVFGYIQNQASFAFAQDYQLFIKQMEINASIERQKLVQTFGFSAQIAANYALPKVTEFNPSLRTGIADKPVWGFMTSDTATQSIFQHHKKATASPSLSIAPTLSARQSTSIWNTKF